MKVDKFVKGAVRQFAYWFAHDHSVTLNGEPKFVEGSQYRPDVEVIISYHSPK